MAPRGPKGPFTLGPWARGPLGPPLAPIQSPGFPWDPLGPPHPAHAGSLRSGPLGPFTAQGPFGAIGGYSEAIASGWPLRADSHYEWRIILTG